MQWFELSTNDTTKLATWEPPLIVRQWLYDKYFPQFQNQGINPVGGTHNSAMVAPTQTNKYLHTTQKGVVNPFSVTGKDEIW